jgi:hypothetical protein
MKCSVILCHILLFRNQSLFYRHELYLDLISGLHYHIGVIIITSKVYLHPDIANFVFLKTLQFIQ